MTQAELALLPEARLGGALLLIFTAALAILLVPAIGLTVAVASLYTEDYPRSVGAFLGHWVTGPRRLGPIQMMPIAYAMAWSLLFVVMTVSKRHATPLVASLGIVVWALLPAGIALSDESALLSGGRLIVLFDALTRVWPQAVAALANLLLAAAFCGYMASGRRPNAYYRRRLPVP